MRRDTERLQDILDAVGAIYRHWPVERPEYESNEVLRFFFLKQVEIVGEAVFKLSATLKSRYPSMPWDKIAGTRHILVHDYFSVDWEILWNILELHIEPFRQQVQIVLDAQT